MPLVDIKNRKVMYAGSPDQKLDFTTMANMAAYTAAIATDPRPTPKILRIAGEVVSARDLAQAAAKAEDSNSSQPFSLMWIGNIWLYERIIWVMRRVMGGEDQLMPPWQGMQYMVNMFSGQGKMSPLDNDRYPDISWTRTEDMLRGRQKTMAETSRH